MTYFIVVCFKDVLVSARRRKRDDNVETCRSCTYKLYNSAFFVLRELLMLP
jgi:hypothetical protein